MTALAIAKEAITLGLLMFDPENQPPQLAEGNAFEKFKELRAQLTARAGAGGRALALSESEHGGEPMEEERTDAGVQEAAPEAPAAPAPEPEPVSEAQPVTLQEQEPPESTPAPEALAREKVTEILAATNLPAASVLKLVEGDYPDEAGLQEAVRAEIEAVKAETGSGKPFAQGASSAPEHKPRTAEEASADFKRILTEVGMPYLVGG